MVAEVAAPIAQIIAPIAPVACKARNELSQDIWDARSGGTGAIPTPGGVGELDDAPVHTFMLPDLSVYEGEKKV